MAFIVWNVQPELLQLGPFTLRWYGLFFAILFTFGYLVVRWQFRVEGRNTAHLDTLLMYVVAGTVIGARLGHVLFYELEYYARHPLQIVAVWQGGLASHGGAVGVLLAVWLFCRRHGYSYLWLMDRIAVPTALAGFFIRMGNLFNSEILGRSTEVPWAFVFARVDPLPRHPAQLYEAIAYALVFVVLLVLYVRQKSSTPEGLLLGSFMVLVFASRFLIEFVKERHADYEAQLLLSTGQLLSIPFVVAGGWLIWKAQRRPRNPAT